jgi:hypothetical protein
MGEATIMTGQNRQNSDFYGNPFSLSSACVYTTDVHISEWIMIVNSTAEVSQSK